MSGWRNPELAPPPSLLPLMSNQLHRVPLILGHRGDSSHAPENTMAAFRAALNGRADGFELDVRLSRDGVPVIIHDASLARTGNRKDHVSRLTSQELKQVDVGSWFNRRHPRLAQGEYAAEGVPALQEVLALARERDAIVYVELKCGRHERESLAAAVVKEINRQEYGRRVVVESFDLPAIGLVRQLDQRMRTAALFERPLGGVAPVLDKSRLIDRALQVGAAEIALHHSLARRRLINAAHQTGLEVVVWTVDHPAWVAKAGAINIKALITNKPRTLLSAREIAAQV